MYIKSIYKLEDQDYLNGTINQDTFVFTNKKKLFFYNNLFVKTNTKDLNDEYTMITYRSDTNHYILGNHNTIKIMDMDLNEQEHFNIHNLKRNINDIFYDRNHYLVTDPLLVYQVKENGEFEGAIINPSDFYQTVTSRCSNTQKIVPNDFTFTSIGTDSEFYYVGFQRHKDAYVSKLSKHGSLISTMFVGSNTRVNSIISYHNKLYLLVVNQDNYLYELGTEATINLELKLQTLLDHMNELVNQIARKEESISNIINAEVSSVNKVINQSTKVEDYLNMNESVKGVVQEATNIEKEAYNSLVILIDIIKELEKLN